MPGLKPSDLPVALNWIIGQPDEKGYLPSRLDELFDKILLFSWENIEQAGVLDLFAKIVLKRINKYKNIIGNEYTDDPFVFKEKDLNKRRSLVEKIVSIVGGADDICYQLVMSKPPLVCKDDIAWLLEKIASNEQEGEKGLFAGLLLIIWRQMGTPHELITPIYELYKADKSNMSVFARYFEAVELSSTEAQSMKEDYNLVQENERMMQAEQKKPKFDRLKLIKEETSCLEQGQTDAWWRFIYYLSVTDDGNHIEDKIDIKKLTGWNSLNIEDETKIADFAFRYLLIQEPEIMIDGNSLSRVNSAAFKAFCYLQSYDSSKYESLPDDIWNKWAKLIVRYPIWIDRDNLMIHQELVKKLYTKSPQITLNYLGKYINVENRNARGIDFLDKFNLCWDDALYDFLLIKIQCKGIQKDTLVSILSKLIELRHEESVEYARALVYEHHKDKALIAAKALLFYTPNSEWPFIWEKINSDTDFGKKLMLGVASSYEHTEVLFPNNLSEIQLSELYIWLSMNFPHHEDPQHDGVFSETARDQMVHLRDGTLNILVSRGNAQSCEAVELINENLPQLDWLATSLERARKIYAEKSWVPPSPQNIIELVKNHNKRLVENGEHLLEVVIEGLQRIQTKLQGETPLAPFLWDQVVKKPKYENDISDFLVSQLRDELFHRGIIINREVEIRSGRSGEEGERTDIHIDAISSFNSHDVVSVIVEVKGCWNRELLTAMESQLVGKYLKDNVCRYGIYLVGWFNCPQWNEKDWRRKDAFQHDLEDIKREFDSQARHLSKSGIEVKAYIIDASLRHSL